VGKFLEIRKFALIFPEISGNFKKFPTSTHYRPKQLLHLVTQSHIFVIKGWIATTVIVVVSG